MPNDALRRLATGFLFGTTGALIALSPLGKESGAHINPIVTLGFWLMAKLWTRVAFGYVVAQLVGACVGSLALLAWGDERLPAPQLRICSRNACWMSWAY